MPSQKVLDLLEELKKLHKAKDTDYAGDEPLKNFKYAEKFGIPAWKGALIRASDKWSRIEELTSKEGVRQVVEESLEDCFRDLAVYCCIIVVLREEAGLGFMPKNIYPGQCIQIGSPNKKLEVEDGEEAE